MNPVGSSHFEISAPPTQPQFLLLREIEVLKIRKTFFKMKLLSKGGEYIEPPCILYNCTALKLCINIIQFFFRRKDKREL